MIAGHYRYDLQAKAPRIPEISRHETQNARAIGQSNLGAKREHDVTGGKRDQGVAHERYAILHPQELVHPGLIHEENLHATIALFADTKTPSARSGSTLPPETIATTFAPSRSFT